MIFFTFSTNYQSELEKTYFFFNVPLLTLCFRKKIFKCFCEIRHYSLFQVILRLKTTSYQVFYFILERGYNHWGQNLYYKVDLWLFLGQLGLYSSCSCTYSHFEVASWVFVIILLVFARSKKFLKILAVMFPAEDWVFDFVGISKFIPIYNSKDEVLVLG